MCVRHHLGLYVYSKWHILLLGGSRGSWVWLMGLQSGRFVYQASEGLLRWKAKYQNQGKVRS